MNECRECGKKTSNPKFCSQSCSASYSNRGVNRHGTGKKHCKFCGQELVGSKKQNIYCDNICYLMQRRYEYIYHWKQGKEDGVSSGIETSNHIRNYLFDRYNSSCQKCGWSERNKFTEKVPLQLHHVDGNWKNNKEGNLQLLCPNCHSLTETFGSSNSGNGRRYFRNKYHEEGD